MSGGEMGWTTETGETRCHSSARAFRGWRIEPAATALRTRRLKWYKSWALYPTEHAGVLAAVFGDS
eukprot:8887039-Pyramimonas_sp.AAC.1